MLSEEAKKKYIENGGNCCPHCGSGDLEGGAVEIDSRIAWQKVWCLECDHSWIDNYTLTSVTEA